MEPRIAFRQGVGIAAGIFQQQELEFKRLYVEQPVLIVVERGVKVLRWPGGEYLIRSGEAICIAGGQSVDITNRLAEDGSYRAHWLVWDDALISEYADANPQQVVIRHAMPMTEIPVEFASAYQRALQAVEDATIPLDIARHRVCELLLWIGVYGGRFEQALPVTLATKIRRLIGQDLAREWSAEAVASAFAMSEATLRRKLSGEDTHLTEILVDARMSMALKLLQSTDLSATQVALSVGYKTPSQFAVRFRHRFGLTPTAVRGRGRGHSR